ncbi:MAG: hypothetical protein AB1393_00300 [Candidatus Edwardsbacteria bacterium]
MLKKFLLPIVLLILSFGVSTAKTTLFVMDLSASGVSEDEVKTMTYRLIAELDKLQERSWFTLVTTEKRESVLKEWALQHTGACDQASCIAKFGKALGVRKIIGGNVGKVGQTYAVTLMLVNVATVKVEKTAVRDYKGEIDGLLGIFSSIAAEIVGKEGITYLGKNNQSYEEYKNEKDGESELGFGFLQALGLRLSGSVFSIMLGKLNLRNHPFI